MAEHLASIFGTEKDRVNCPFYFKIGACRHGDRCSRLHTKPSISPTLLLSNMYQRLDNAITPGLDSQGQPMDPRQIQEHFENFYEDLFEELSKYGEIESLNVCDNLADHMVGNVYVQFREEEHAANALRNLTGRFYAGRPIIVDFSPVTDFREATCRQYEENTCNRGGGKEAAVEAEAPIARETLKTVMEEAVAVASVMVTGISLLKNEAENLEAEAQVVGGTAAGALLQGEGIEVLSEKEAPSEGPKLSSGTGKGSRQMLPERTMNTHRMVSSIMIQKNEVIDIYGFLVQVFLLLVGFDSSLCCLYELHFQDRGGNMPVSASTEAGRPNKASPVSL
ncbi:splicing factor U2af small subunit [Musa troglodytarum]|uniref:Splicing factor U2af small subunit n=1 Tax=Musa troglodytarum TaxID=320322 RepID=A0A9E7JDI3_9LILI|nr:splicing factor U2af small subunit [Musa troglodytarum]